jgi:hypothetical protein
MQHPPYYISKNADLSISSNNPRSPFFPFSVPTTECGHLKYWKKIASSLLRDAIEWTFIEIYSTVENGGSTWCSETKTAWLKFMLWLTRNRSLLRVLISLMIYFRHYYIPFVLRHQNKRILQRSGITVHPSGRLLLGGNFVDSFRTGQGWSCSKAVYKPVWRIPVPSVQRINCWWWAEELPETCRVSCRSKFGKFVHLVGFIIKKFVMMQHGHMNIKLVDNKLF